MNAPHIPVMVEEVLAAVDPAPGALLVDGTFGAGGYTRAFLERGASVVAFDRDPTAVESARAAGMLDGARLTLHETPFSRMAEFVEPGAADGVVLDIGVSSMQIDQPERGFSFLRDGPLDMRMGGDGPTAAAVVNQLAVNDLIRVIGLLGEEKRAAKVAHAIADERARAPIETTERLARIVEKALPRKHDDRIHPATRTFQALRIYVNDELNELAKALHSAERLLGPDGVLAVVTFHSLEDRIVKRFIAERSGGSRGSRHLPATEMSAPTFEPIGKQGIGPTESETARNPRARSARLRAARRLPGAARSDAPEPTHALPPLATLGGAE